jgi:hypothetical protein
MVPSIRFWRPNNTSSIYFDGARNQYGVFQGCSYVCLFGLFVLFLLCFVCFRNSFLCLVYVGCRWMCLCCISLHVCILSVLFRSIALSGPCTVGDSPCISVCISRYSDICCFSVVLVVGVPVWCSSF